jgi:predicted DNA-binding protein YlxM (UPF0122 family)
MRKLNKDQIAEIVKLYSTGKTTVEIAKMFNVSQPNITYWTNPASRQKRIDHAAKTWMNKTPEEKKLSSRKKKDYLRNYMRKRYQTDETFRKKQIERQHIQQAKSKVGVPLQTSEKEPMIVEKNPSVKTLVGEVSGDRV